eukprot:tig00021038_g17506.t1
MEHFYGNASENEPHNTSFDGSDAGLFARTPLPGDVAINGSIATSTRSRAFRGPRPITVPIALNAVHFKSDEGRARYKASVPNEENSGAEVGLATFRPELQSQNEVAVRVDMSVAPTYLLVDVKTKNSPLEFIAGIWALAFAAKDYIGTPFERYLDFMKWLKLSALPLDVHVEDADAAGTRLRPAPSAGASAGSGAVSIPGTPDGSRGSSPVGRVTSRSQRTSGSRWRTLDREDSQSQPAADPRVQQA